MANGLQHAARLTTYIILNNNNRNTVGYFNVYNRSPSDSTLFSVSENYIFVFVLDSDCNSLKWKTRDRFYF